MYIVNMYAISNLFPIFVVKYICVEAIKCTNVYCCFSTSTTMYSISKHPCSYWCALTLMSVDNVPLSSHTQCTHAPTLTSCALASDPGIEAWWGGGRRLAPDLNLKTYFDHTILPAVYSSEVSHLISPATIWHHVSFFSTPHARQQRCTGDAVTAV